MVITFLGGWFEIFRLRVNFLPPTLLAEEWEVRFAHFLYQKIFIAKKWPNFKHFFFLKILAYHGKVPRKRPIFRRIFFHKFWASYGKVPKKGRFFGGFFFLKILAFQGKVPKKADFFQNFSAYFPTVFWKIHFLRKKGQNLEFFLKMTGEDNIKSFQK